jgi:hypothetical protein
MSACRWRLFNEAKVPPMRTLIDIDYVHSWAIAREIGERLRTWLKPEPELPASFRMQINRLHDEEKSPTIIPEAEH